MSDTAKIGDHKKCPICGHLSFALSAAALKRLQLSLVMGAGPTFEIRTVYQPNDGIIIETAETIGPDPSAILEEEYGIGWVCSRCGEFENFSN